MPRPPQQDFDSEALDERPSKTQRKQAMHALQDLGAELLTLPEPVLATVAMSERLRDALAEHRRITSFEAKRRQLQYIGKLLRVEDPEPLRQAIEAQRQRQIMAVQSVKQAELWRERLLADDAALTAWLAAHPGGDTRALRSLIRDARRELEQAQEQTPGQPSRKGRRYRELYQLLRDTLQRPGESADEAGDEA